MGTDLRVWLLVPPDHYEYVLQLRLDALAKAGHFLADISERQETIRIDRLMPNIVAVYVHQAAAADFEASAAVNERLEGPIEQGGKWTSAAQFLKGRWSAAKWGPYW